jgi:hypothetical protein
MAVPVGPDVALVAGVEEFVGALSPLGSHASAKAATSVTTPASSVPAIAE